MVNTLEIIIKDPIDTDMWCKLQNSVYNKGYDIEEEYYFTAGFIHYTGKYILYKRYNLIFMNVRKQIFKFKYYFDCNGTLIIIKIDDVSRKSYKKIQDLVEYLFNEFDYIKVKITLTCKN